MGWSQTTTVNTKWPRLVKQRNLTMNFRILVIGLILGSFLLTGCNGKDRPEPYRGIVERVTGGEKKRTEGSDSILVDLYLDATLSMEGFCAAPNSNFHQFLQDLEGAVQNGWRNAKPRYFKFGAGVREIDRQTFVQAQKGGTFFHEQGMFESTNIDLVVNSTNNQRVSLVITDLLQNEGDINTLVENLK